MKYHVRTVDGAMFFTEAKDLHADLACGDIRVLRASGMRWVPVSERWEEWVGTYLVMVEKIVWAREVEE